MTTQNNRIAEKLATFAGTVASLRFAHNHVKQVSNAIDSILLSKMTGYSNVEIQTTFGQTADTSNLLHISIYRDNKYVAELQYVLQANKLVARQINVFGLNVEDTTEHDANKSIDLQKLFLNNFFQQIRSKEVTQCVIDKLQTANRVEELYALLKVHANELQSALIMQSDIAVNKSIYGFKLTGDLPLLRKYRVSKVDQLGINVDTSTFDEQLVEKYLLYTRYNNSQISDMSSIAQSDLQRSLIGFVTNIEPKDILKLRCTYKELVAERLLTQQSIAV